MKIDDPTLTAYCQYFNAAINARWTQESLEQFDEALSAARDNLAGPSLGMMVWIITALLRKRVPQPEQLEQINMNPDTFYKLLDGFIGSTEASPGPGELVH